MERAAWLSALIMVLMPFTLSHPAAAIPFLRTRLVPSALVIGCMAPDFEYFMRFSPGGKFGHTLPGVFIFDLPVAFITLWLFHAFAKEPLYAWLPESVRRRIRLGPPALEIKNLAQLGLVLLSILTGVATHIVWDSFTHKSLWPYQHWQFLHRMIFVPVIGPMECRRVIQHASTVFGAVVLLLWFRGWYRRTAPNPPATEPRPRKNERGALYASCFTALFASGVRGVVIPLLAEPHLTALGKDQFECAVITAISVFSLGVAAYGVVRARMRNGAQNAQAG